MVGLESGFGHSIYTGYQQPVDQWGHRIFVFVLTLQWDHLRREKGVRTIFLLEAL